MRKELSGDSLDNENPRKNANFLSYVTFWFTIKIFRVGHRRDLDEADLTKPLEEHKSSVLGDKMARLWSAEVERAAKKNRTPKLVKVIFKCFFWEFFGYGFLLFSMEMGIRLFQPFCLGLVLRYFSQQNKEHVVAEVENSPTYLLRIFSYWTPQSPIKKPEAFVFALGVVTCSLLSVMILHPFMMGVMHIGMKIRVACCSLMYRKSLRISLESLGGNTVGNVMNLMSNDVNRFDVAPMFFHYLWVSPIQVIVIMYFMYREMAMGAVYGLCAIFVFIPVQAYFGHITSTFRLKTALKTDERVRLMNEIIQGIQVIKMYTWEYAFSDMVYRARVNEIKVLKYTSYVRGMIMSFIMFTSRFGIFLTCVTYVIMDYPISAEKVFFITSFYQILRQNMTLYFPQGVAMLAEAHVAISRIQLFMLSPETEMGDPTPIDPLWKTRTRKYSTTHNTTFLNDPSLPTGISIVKASAKYENEVCLSKISLELKAGQLTALIGQVGSGKSCLLNLILGELRPFDGTVTVNGEISFSCQEPWLFAGSVRQNILFGRAYERVRYQEVVKACALARDFDLLPYGDRTIVGERGISLSGGQRARVNLARAVYKKADVYLLDDPLSAVDTQVGKHMFENCINGYLRSKVVVLATHQLQYLKEAEQIVILEDGFILAKGSHSELQATGLNFAKLLDELPPTEIEDEHDKLQSALKKISIQNAHSASIIDVEGIHPNEPIETAEMRTYGSVSSGIYKEYFKAGASCLMIILMILMFLLAQAFASGGDVFLCLWVRVEEHRAKHDEGFHLQDLTTDRATLIFTAIILFTVFVALSRSFIFYRVCLKASVNLHNRMFNSICTASMRFFNTNSSGRILNRFSKDLGSIDEFLPNAMIDCAQITLNLLGVVVVVAYINRYLLIPTAIVCVAFYLLRRYYLCTSRSVKRLDGIARSPVFAHLNATLQGLTTIRANGAEVILTKEFDRFQDIHSSAWYMFIATSRAFGYWLDCMCAVYIGVVTISFLLQDKIFSGDVGLAITQAIGLTGLFQWGMRQSAELENQMTSVERVLEFTKVEHEPNLKSVSYSIEKMLGTFQEAGKEPPETWPTEGRIKFEDATMRYSLDDPPVLKGLTFTIEPKEKIGIVGRTGAGKSSLIGALFRLAYFEGKIWIDEINIGDIGLHDLRRKVSIIPQEPVLFSGTLRYNLDPFDQYSDENLLNALLVVEIKVAMVEGKDSLKHNMTGGGVNMSVGQRQLICLARAILRNNRILVMDEATANVDPETDKFIQTTIRDKFSHCTVLTIAHRLHTVMDSDRVLVLDAGQVMEMDHPHILLQKKDGLFSQMVDKTGPVMTKALKKIAKDNYEKKHPATGASSAEEERPPTPPTPPE